MPYGIPGGSGGKAPRVLQAAVNGADGAGVTNFTLPANFRSWRRLTVAVWEGAGNDIAEVTAHTELIAAQTGATKDFILTRGASGAQPAILRYTRASRTLAIQNGGATTGNADRIIYAVLED